MKPAKDDYREDRIFTRAVVDAYGPEEQATSWHYYLEEELSFPFRARCSRRKATSPLKVGHIYQVTGMADVADCGHDMFVKVGFDGGQLAVPLSQLEPADEVDEDTHEAILDWHYWVERGYQF